MSIESQPAVANGPHRLNQRLAHRTLLAVTAFSAVSAVGGGVGLLITDGLGMPLSFLTDGPFHSFVWPGMLLLFVIGGTQTLALVLLLRRAPARLMASAVAGFGMVIWITVEVALIKEFSWLHAVYLAAGLLQLAAVLGELGIVPQRQSSPT